MISLFTIIILFECISSDIFHCILRISLEGDMYILKVINKTEQPDQSSNRQVPLHCHKIDVLALIESNGVFKDRTNDEVHDDDK